MQSYLVTIRDGKTGETSIAGTAHGESVQDALHCAAELFRPPYGSTVSLREIGERVYDAAIVHSAAGFDSSAERTEERDIRAVAELVEREHRMSPAYSAEAHSAWSRIVERLRRGERAR